MGVAPDAPALDVAYKLTDEDIPGRPSLTAIALFGPESGAALATVVGVLVEVPVMLSVCSICNRTRHWCETPAVPWESIALTPTEK